MGKPMVFSTSTLLTVNAIFASMDTVERWPEYEVDRCRPI